MQLNLSRNYWKHYFYSRLILITDFFLLSLLVQESYRLMDHTFGPGWLCCWTDMSWTRISISVPISTVFLLSSSSGRWFFYFMQPSGCTTATVPPFDRVILSSLLILFSFFLLKPIAGANDDCLVASCGAHQPEIRFPFHILGRQPTRCGFPGFNLSCDEQNQTIIRLPSSRSYIVNRISYVSQVIYIDPEYLLFPNLSLRIHLHEHQLSLIPS
ncbi:unnamed protein product [Lactuca virosa]|uniref:RING-type E3 ubiquitin transferase n=1 Tax=Lactuca virosa TaxID=75947 RepID=A0AAU9PG12_9ASTR|nr:unnamed protein product [Lactuca virosa]